MGRAQYVAADVHKATTTFVVRNGRGRIVQERVVRSESRELVDFVCALDGEVHLVYEECTCAEWLWELWRPWTDELIVWNPRERRGIVEKSDHLDASDLSERLWRGGLRSVYHGESEMVRLKQIGQAYRSLVGDSVRLQNRLKSLWWSRGRSLVGSATQVEAGRARELSGHGRTERAEWLRRELQVVEQLREEAGKALLAESRRHRACGWLASVPGIGPVRSAVIVSQMVTPLRFRSKRQLWKYSGLAVVTHTSSDYQVVKGEIRRRIRQSTRGLNRDFNPLLKCAFKSAAVDASRRGVLKPHFEQLVAGGMRPEMATLTLARKIAATCLALWKKGERYKTRVGTNAAD